MAPFHSQKVSWELFRSKQIKPHVKCTRAARCAESHTRARGRGHSTPGSPQPDPKEVRSYRRGVSGGRPLREGTRHRRLARGAGPGPPPPSDGGGVAGEQGVGRPGQGRALRTRIGGLPHSGLSILSRSPGAPTLEPWPFPELVTHLSRANQPTPPL